MKGRELCLYREPHNYCHAKVWENHLTEFYDAIKEKDLEEVNRIEHLLTPDEKCVACVYALRTRGQLRQAILTKLNQNNNTATTSLINWFTHLWQVGLKVGVFLLFWLIIVLVISYIRVSYFSISNQYTLSNISPLDLTIGLFTIAPLMVLFEEN